MRFVDGFFMLFCGSLMSYFYVGVTPEFLFYQIAIGVFLILFVKKNMGFINFSALCLSAIYILKYVDNYELLKLLVVYIILKITKELYNYQTITK